MRATYSTKLRLFDLITLTFVEEYKLWNLSLSNFLNPPVTSCHLGIETKFSTHTKNMKNIKEHLYKKMNWTLSRFNLTKSMTFCVISIAVILYHDAHAECDESNLQGSFEEEVMKKNMLVLSSQILKLLLNEKWNIKYTRQFCISTICDKLETKRLYIHWILFHKLILYKKT